MQFVSAYIETPASPRENLVVFSNGVLNTAVSKVDNIETYINLTWNGNTYNPNQWSQYFLTDNVIFYRQVNGQPWYLYNNAEYRKYSGNIGGTGSHLFIPVKRLYGYKTLKSLCKMDTPSVGSTYFYSGVYAMAIVDNSYSGAPQVATHENEWTWVECDISNLPYIDYIVLLGCDGPACVKEIILEV